MTILISSLLVSVSLIVLASLAAVQSAPLDVVSHITLYLGVPAAYGLSLMVVSIMHVLRKGKHGIDPEMASDLSKQQLQSFDQKQVA